MAVNGVSAEHRRHLDAGGLGVSAGDGRLPHPGDEILGERYYALAAFACATPIYQFVVKPGYNRDCAPVSVFTVRARAGF